MSRTTKHPNEFPKWRMMRMGSFKNRQAEQEDRDRKERFRKIREANEEAKRKRDYEKKQKRIEERETPTLDSLKATVGQISRAGDRLRQLLKRRKK